MLHFLSHHLIQYNYHSTCRTVVTNSIFPESGATKIGSNREQELRLYLWHSARTHSQSGKSRNRTRRLLDEFINHLISADSTHYNYSEVFSFWGMIFMVDSVLKRVRALMITVGIASSIRCSFNQYIRSNHQFVRLFSSSPQNNEYDISACAKQLNLSDSQVTSLHHLQRLLISWWKLNDDLVISKMFNLISIMF